MLGGLGGDNSGGIRDLGPIRQQDSDFKNKVSVFQGMPEFNGNKLLCIGSRDASYLAGQTRFFY